MDDRAEPSNPQADTGIPQGVQERGKWANKTEFMLSMAGEIIGLGNVWRFPYLCFKNGGGVFFIPYFVFLFFCGIPVFFLETALGQYTGEGGVTAWRKICPMFEGIGIAWQILVLYINVYYIVILAWAMFYLFNSFKSPLPWSTCYNVWNTGSCQNQSNVGGHWPNMTDDYYDIYDTQWTTSEEEFWNVRVLGKTAGLEEPLGHVRWDLALCLLLAWVVCYFCIWKGVKSIGKAVYFTATFPYLLLLILFFRGVSLPGAWEGLKYYLYPDISKIASISVWCDAGFDVFFSLALSQGVFTALGSYNKYNNDCYKDCLALCILSSATSIFAGFVVFSVLGFLAHELNVSIPEVASSGPGLAFMTFPKALSLLPGAQFWSVLFFLMLVFLGLDCQFICVESLCTAVADMFPHVLRRPGRRELLVLGISVVCFLFGLILVTNGGIHVFSLIDTYGVSGTSLLIVACFETVVIGWVYGANRFYDNIEDMIGYQPFPVIKYCWLFITPIICTITLFLNMTHHWRQDMPWLSLAFACLLMLTPLMCIPVYIFVTLCKSSAGDRNGEVLEPCRSLRQACPHKPRLTLCECVVFQGQRASLRGGEEDKMVDEGTSGV